MPRNQENVEMIANQMMKGPKAGRYAIGSTPTERQEFLERYGPMIEELLPFLPRGSSAIGAAVMKCALKYNKEKAFEFAKNIKDGMFNGKNDPVYLLWSYLQTRRSSKSKSDRTIDIYRMTATACTAWCEERTLSELRARATDIFEWDEDWQPRLKNSSPRN